MNRGFNYYFKEGVGSSAKMLYGNKKLIKSVLWLFIELFALVTVIFYPLVILAKVRIGESVRLKNNFEISQCFKDTDRPYSVWTLVLTFCVQGLILLAGVLAIAVVTALSGLLGYVISYTFIGDKYNYLIAGCFMIPGGVMLLVYAFFALLTFAPAPYIVATNPQAGVADVLSSCFNTMKYSGKFTLFLNVFIPSLIISLYTAFVVGGGFAIYYFVPNDYYLLLSVIWIIVGVIGLTLIAPIFVFAARCANQHLFCDITVDPADERLVPSIDELIGDTDDIPAVKFELESGEEPLPTVTDVLNDGQPEGAESVTVPTVDVTETSVEPGVEQIIKDAEKRANATKKTGGNKKKSNKKKAS